MVICSGGYTQTEMCFILLTCHWCWIMNSRSSIDSTQSLAELDEGLAIPQFRLPEQQRLLSIIGWLRGFLNELPDLTPCLQCGDVTANRVRAHISHEEFHCTVPVSICSTCSKKTPCAKTEINQQLWWSVLLGGFAVAFGLGQQWLLSILAAAGVAVVRVRFAGKFFRLHCFWVGIPESTR
jgi:hypothetical protein